MSHTPGPWSCTFASSYGDYVVHSADHYILAFCPTAHPKDNVYLIAAAPELLAACEALLEYYDTGIDWAYSEGALKDSEYNDAIHKMENAKAAIKKAKGETK